MTPGFLNIFIVSSILQSVTVSHGFMVLLHTEQSNIISCEHEADNAKLRDVRLYRISPKTGESILCQKGRTDCKDIIMHPEKSKYVFIFHKPGPDEMDFTYECEITVTINDIDYTKRSKSSKLLPVGQEPEEKCASPPPPPPQPKEIMWILIGLLALTLMYSLTITSFYITLRKSINTCENSVYEDMRMPGL